jgi:MYXO-CTERM domain-containing protein
MSSCPGWGSWLGPAGSGSKFGIAASSSAPDVAEQGTFYAFFHATANVADCVGQTLNTVPGNKYVVSFWLATDGPTDGTTDLMQLSWGPDFGASSNDVVINSFAPHSSSAVPYQQFTYTITAITSHDIFTFHGYDATSNILLDNVTVTALPGEADGGPTDAGISDASAEDSGLVDAATEADAGHLHDAGTTVADAGPLHDAGTTEADAGPLHDAGIDVEVTDATRLDGSEDGGATSSDATVVSSMDATPPGVDEAGNSEQDGGSGAPDAVAANEADDAAALSGTGGEDGSVGAAPGNSGGGCGCAVVGSDPAPTDIALLLSIAAIGLAAARRRSSRRPAGVPAR